ncbi:RNA polymerase II degradation factor 1 [Cyclopterus lumpus]|uniref:RNA polymerase II degradation factor 1 n=1 Tax=Cyclopterus lumpus TaxID=8103 RepID=UPI001486A000|nr:RNA polymerase II degradation factor 1 [Cyclopterus lumpus]XP_034409038.1 RNA polymerase II degradation factor 1 [Cyclopterus lumpus]XP_034409039.1 RNA polymerase II degradation factor 1 [Cyclopterus lumpus]XP_034409040.1 RNA polymerase II degradation factor 1 [Cyclopterus lumpus]XP_034409041.1 RNA polymerase II degradation factor 1 [Cyclopterus lumpus]
MTEYYEEGGLLYEQSPPMHIKVESPEGPFGGGASENGFPREDDDSEGSCDQSSGLPGGLPFNVVVVHPNIMAPGMSSDELLSIEQNRAMSAALAAGGAGKRKSRFSGAELEVLVSEVTRCEGELFGPAGRLRRRERERIWAGILERVNAVSRVPRTLREVKKRWDDLKRRNGGRLADARHRSCYLPSSRGASMLGRPSQTSPRLSHTRQKQSSRPKPSFPCFPDSDTGVGVEGSERDGLEKDEDNTEQDRDMGESECEPGENSMEDKLGLGLGLGIGPPPPSERWLPPSPLYSAPFLNGSPQPSSPQPSLGAHQGPLEAPPRSSWLEDELRGLGEAAIQLGNRVEKSLREFGDGFRQDMTTLVASQEALASSLQQNNVLLQRLLGVLEAQQQPQQHRVQQAHQSQTSQQHLQPAQQQQLLQQTEPLQQQQQRVEAPLQTQLLQHQQQQQQPQVGQQSQQHQTQIQQLPQVTQHSNNQSAVAVVPAPSSPDVHGTCPSESLTNTNGSVQRPRRGRAVDHRRRRRR